MRKVITYGSFDLFHKGHYELLKRAMELGDYLIVGIMTEHYDRLRGKLNLRKHQIQLSKGIAVQSPFSGKKGLNSEGGHYVHP